MSLPPRDRLVRTVVRAALFGIIWFVGQLVFWDDVSTAEAAQVSVVIFVFLVAIGVVMDGVAARRKP